MKWRSLNKRRVCTYSYISMVYKSGSIPWDVLSQHLIQSLYLNTVCSANMSPGLFPSSFLQRSVTHKPAGATHTWRWSEMYSPQQQQQQQRETRRELTQLLSRCSVSEKHAGTIILVFSDQRASYKNLQTDHQALCETGNSAICWSSAHIRLLHQ